MGVKRVFFETPWLWKKGGVQVRRVRFWVWSSAWCEKGVMRRFCKNALRVCGEIKERACVQSFWLAKLLGKISNDESGFLRFTSWVMDSEHHSTGGLVTSYRRKSSCIWLNPLWLKWSDWYLTNSSDPCCHIMKSALLLLTWALLLQGEILENFPLLYAPKRFLLAQSPDPPLAVSALQLL